MIEYLYDEAIKMLKHLIETPSLSGQEKETADIIFNYLKTNGLKPFRKHNNVWAFSENFEKNKPTILLNSHHDTVPPVEGWTMKPTHPKLKDGKLYGLGSNDAGGSLVALLQTFLHFKNTENQSFNLIFAATGEEEISGKQGIESILADLGHIDLAIVGEPTLMQMAVAEKGLMVVDGTAHGVAGHAARNEGENALYKAVDDINWIRNYTFPKISETLGNVKMSVTQIEAGKRHNIVPDVCRFVVDIRTTEMYSNQEVFEILKANLKSEIVARSFRLNSSKIALDHPLVKRGIELGLTTYGSPTLSDQALMPFTSIKIGAGDSARSHTADEFIYVDEIKEAIGFYIHLLDKLMIEPR